VQAAQPARIPVWSSASASASASAGESARWVQLLHSMIASRGYSTESSKIWQTVSPLAGVLTPTMRRPLRSPLTLTASKSIDGNSRLII